MGRTDSQRGEQEEITIDLFERDKLFRENRKRLKKHNWKQRGPEVFCRGETHEAHGFYVKPGYGLKKINGEVQLTKLW